MVNYRRLTIYILSTNNWIFGIAMAEVIIFLFVAIFISTENTKYHLIGWSIWLIIISILRVRFWLSTIDYDKYNERLK